LTIANLIIFSLRRLRTIICVNSN